MVTEKAVRERYRGAARQAEASLCCPINHDPKYLEVIPAEVIERDYGCGDPSRWAREGDTGSISDLAREKSALSPPRSSGRRAG